MSTNSDRIGNADRRIFLKKAGAFLSDIGLVSACGASAHVMASPTSLRTALVIGNASYRNAILPNPVNDARLMTRTLTDIGYEVLKIENASTQQILDATRKWLRASLNAEIRVFYFAGHGVQVKGKNFLIPVDADFRSEEEVLMQSVNATEIIDRLSRFDRGVNVVILDACRNSPFPLMASNMRSRGITGPQGLSAEIPPQGTVVAYSTSPGSVAIDGVRSSNSIYTAHLAEEIKSEGLPIEVVFKRVRAAVIRETQNSQVPWESSSLTGDFCFRPSTRGQCAFGGATSKPESLPSIDLKKMQTRP
jgi:uncharacterized caspase-like protein